MTERSPTAAPKRSPLLLAVRWPVQRAWQLRNPEKIRAHQAVRHAIKRGDLIRGPCEDCGTTRGVEAHHPDYSQPLSVVWLCRRDHKRRHSRGGGANPLASLRG